jgi:hypothetical protein
MLMEEMKRHYEGKKGALGVSNDDNGYNANLGMVSSCQLIDVHFNPQLANLSLILFLGFEQGLVVVVEARVSVPSVSRNDDYEKMIHGNLLFYEFSTSITSLFCATVSEVGGVEDSENNQVMIMSGNCDYIKLFEGILAGASDQVSRFSFSFERKVGEGKGGGMTCCVKRKYCENDEQAIYAWKVSTNGISSHSIIVNGSHLLGGWDGIARIVSRSNKDILPLNRIDDSGLDSFRSPIYAVGSCEWKRGDYLLAVGSKHGRIAVYRYTPENKDINT